MKLFIGTIILSMALISCQKQEMIATNNSQPDELNWQFLTHQSTLSFITTKNKVVTEEHSFKFNDGQIKHNHVFTATIDLASVDTQIPIRDQRLKDILFETEEFPHAIINASIPNDLTFDQVITVPFTLNLHGYSHSYHVPILLQKVTDQMVVINYEPIVVSAKDFALDDAINQLTKIAGLQSINYEVQVDFKLVFEK